MTAIRRRYRPCVLGIDQSLLGFAATVLFRDGQFTSYKTAFPTSEAIGVDRLGQIGNYVTWLVAKYDGIEHVCMEGYSAASKFGREKAGELGAVVKLALRTAPGLRSPTCYPTIVSPHQLKKFVANKTSAKKSDMKMYVLKHWGVEFDDDDKADSYGLAQMAAAIQWRDGELLAYQKDALKALRYHTELKE